MADITVHDLAHWRAHRDDFIVVDIREPWELQISMLPEVEHVPMRDILADPKRVPQDRDVVLICRTGHRTGMLATWLENTGHQRVYNVVGGMNEWSRSIDPSVKQY